MAHRLLPALGALLLLSACAETAPPICAPDRPLPPLSVQVVDHGWHTDLALPADGLTGPLAGFRRFFPGLRVLVVGFGRRSFMTAPARGIGDYLVGPFPGDGVLLVAGLAGAPAAAYEDGGTVLTIPLTGAQRDRLDRFVWDSFASAVPIGRAPFAGGVFFASTVGYAGWETCNTWTVQALAAAGLPVSATLAVLAGQAMGRAAPLAPGGMCRIR
jgi:hypothetical protein